MRQKHRQAKSTRLLYLANTLMLNINKYITNTQTISVLIKSATVFIFIFLCNPILFANSFEKPLLVLDMRNAKNLPKKFHTTSDTLPQGFNSEGLNELKIAGSAQFSKLAFISILHRLKQKSIIVIDLRQESHGLLDNHAISWYGWRNAANKNLTPKQIEQEQTILLEKLKEQRIATVNKILKKTFTGSIRKSQPIDYVIHQVVTEEDYINSINSIYKRFYVQDFHAPNNKEVDNFIMSLKSLPKNKWIYFHCRGGSGRTTTFMVMYDMLHNAKKVSFADILARQVALGGKDLTLLPDKNNFKYQAAMARLNFIKKFFQYARDNQDNFTTLWSQWLKQKEK